MDTGQQDAFNLGSAPQSADRRPFPTNFDEYVPWACRQLQLQIGVTIKQAAVTQGIKQVNSPKQLAANQVKSIGRTTSVSTSMHEYRSQVHASLNSLVQTASTASEKKRIKIVTVYDATGNLTQLKFNDNRTIPCQLFKIIGLILKFHVNMTKITINRGLNYLGVRELEKLLNIANITEICLDNTILIDANYEILLDKETRLSQLSLARCNIDDKIVKRIASKLAYPLPGCKSLSVLNLASNKINDSGAKFLADMLRSNRSLRYLNVSDNSITDEGSKALLDVLHKFAVTDDEIKSTRIRFIEDLKERYEKQSETNAEQTAVQEKDKKSKARKLKLNQRAEKNQTVDEFTDPFSSKNIKIIDDIVYCKGNNYLAYLNLSYNNVSYITIKKLLTVLMDQKENCRSPRGLIRVCIEGNFTPESCPEFNQIDEILQSIVLPNEKLIKKVND